MLLRTSVSVGGRLLTPSCRIRSLQSIVLHHYKLKINPLSTVTTSFGYNNHSLDDELKYKQFNNHNNNHGHQLRFFSTSPPPTDKKEEKPSSPEGGEESEEGGIMARVFRTVVTPQNQFYALVAGGTFGAYLISRVVLSFTSFFTHLTPTTIAKWGFYTGFGTASVLGGLAAMTADNLYIRADPVFQYCSNWVTGDSKVQQVLGDGLKPGSLRSYRLDSGKMQFDYQTKSPVWRPPRIQMIFDVSAEGPPYRTGLVTCEAVKQAGFPWGKLQTTLLKVDYETGNEHEAGGTIEGDETLWLVGSASDLTRVSSRSGISLDKLASYCHINRAAKKV